MRPSVIGVLLAIGMLAIGSGRLRQAIQAGFSFSIPTIPTPVTPAGKVARKVMRK